MSGQRRGGTTAGQGDNRAMECAWRRLGRGGNTTGAEGSVLDVTGRGTRGGTETGFEFEFVMVDNESWEDEPSPHRLHNSPPLSDPAILTASQHRIHTHRRRCALAPPFTFTFPTSNPLSLRVCACASPARCCCRFSACFFIFEACSESFTFCGAAAGRPASASG